MAEFISFQPSDFFSTKLYTGNDSTNAITGVGFQPDFTWLKYRNGTSTQTLQSSVIGDYYLSSANQDGKTAAPNWDSFDSDGFTISGTNSNYNASGYSYCSWNWKAGTTSGITGGTITPTTYSINTTSGIGMYEYDGNGTNGATIAHGLGAVPHMIWIKSTSNTTDWYCSHHNLNNSTNPWNYAYALNTTGADYADTGLYDTAPTSSLVTIGNVTNTNNSGKSYLMYVFVGKSGYSKFSVYKGTGNADGAFVYTGFRPAWFMAINSDSAGSNKYIFDDKRLGYNPDNNVFSCNANTAEGTDDIIDFLSNGIKVRIAGNPNNTDNWCYAAFAEFPVVSSNDVPGVAR